MALVAAILMGAATVRAADSTILILSGGLGAEEDRLVEALRIYTGDVESRLVLAGKAPSTPEPRAIEQLTKTARAEGADIVVWGGRRPDGQPIFYVLNVATRDLRETEIEPLGADRAAVDVALKVRALLFHRRGRADDEAHAAGGVAVASKPAPAAAAPPAPAALVGPPAPTAGPAVLSRAATLDRSALHRIELSAAYELVVPTDPTWLRHALLLGAELRLGHGALRPVSIFVDGALSTRPAATVRGFDVTVIDVPIGAGLLVTRAWTGVSVAAGPRASLHAFDVRANDGSARSGAAWRYALGLGGIVRVDLTLATYMKVYLGASIEALVPKQQFTIAVQPAVDTGSMLSGLSGGLEWLIL